MSENPNAKLNTSSVETQRDLRVITMNKLIEKGINPFPAGSKRDFKLMEVKTDFQNLTKKFTENSSQKITIAGRIKRKRSSGKIGFVVLEDESLPSGFQLVFKSDILPVETIVETQLLSYTDFKTLIDDGDYIQASGYLAESSTGEPSLYVQEFKILTKSLRPLPVELSDMEQKYRQRYIDMRLHPEVREMFVMKSRFWSATREYMISHGFLEIHMPTMEETTGGAEASPFTTHHNALDQDFYLRISSELHQKRMIVGGFEKIFDIDKNFRNEGIDDEHLQEFVQMEFYWAYANFDDLINFTEDLTKFTIQKTFGTMNLEYKGKMIDWSKPWPRMPYFEFIKHFGGLDISYAKTVADLQKIADENNIKYEETDGFGRLLDLIYKRTARTKCIEPVWLIDHPVEISPLAKRKTDNPNLTQRIQLIAYGSELNNGFSELNDPIDQKARFEEQQSQRDGGDDEAMMIDEDFVEALEIGMPPTAGFAYSERLFSVLAQKPIRETTPFPLMKPKK
jgi:lysyl-tRNA synthetase class 2